MKTIKKEIKVYKYDELEEIAKQNVKERIFYDEDSKYFTQLVIEDLKEKWNIKNLRPYYNLQKGFNKGLCLLGHIYLEDIGNELNKTFFKNFEILDYKVIKSFPNHSLIEFKNYSNYCSSSAVNIDIYINGCQYKKTNPREDKTVSKLIKNIENWYFAICHEYEIELHDWLYNSDNEEFKQYIEAKNYEFLEDGTIFN